MTIWQETLPSERIFDARQENPSCRMYRLSNFGASVYTYGSVIKLPDVDIGEGTTFFPLIDKSMDYNVLDWCVMDLNKAGVPRRDQLRLRAMSAIRKLHFPLNDWWFKRFLRPFGSFSDTISFVELSKSPDGGLWLLVHGGYPELSEAVMNPPRGRYKRGEEQLKDMRLVQVIAALNRQCFAKALLKLYYNVSDISEVVYRGHNQPIHTVSCDKSSLALDGVWLKNGQAVLYLAGMARGAYLLRKGRTKLPRGPVPTHLGRLDVPYGTNPQWRLALEAETVGIHCEKPFARTRYLGQMYQRLPEFTQQAGVIRLSPVYNIRSCDLESLREKYEPGARK